MILSLAHFTHIFYFLVSAPSEKLKKRRMPSRSHSCDFLPRLSEEKCPELRIKSFCSRAAASAASALASAYAAIRSTEAVSAPTLSTQTFPSVDEKADPRAFSATRGSATKSSERATPLTWSTRPAPASREFSLATSTVCGDDDSDDDDDDDDDPTGAILRKIQTFDSLNNTIVSVRVTNVSEQPSLSQIKDQVRRRQEDLDASIAELSKFLDEPTYLPVESSSRAQKSSAAPRVTTDAQAAALRDLYASTAIPSVATDTSSGTTRKFISEESRTPNSYQFTTLFAQQVLIRHGYPGVLDSVDALHAFNRIMNTGSLEAESPSLMTANSTIAASSSILAGKPGPVHVPALATVAINASSDMTSPGRPASQSPIGRNLAPPSPPLEETVIGDEIDEGFTSILDIGSQFEGSVEPSIACSAVGDAVTATADDGILARFRAIKGIDSLFPGLHGSESSTGLSDNTAEVPGITHAIADSSNPMSIAALTCQEPTPSSSSSSAQGRQDYYSGIAGIDTFLTAAAAAGSNNGYDSSRSAYSLGSGRLSSYTYNRRRAISVTNSRSSQEDDEEENSDSASSIYAATTASTGSSATFSIVQAPPLIPPPVNFNTHPARQQLTHTSLTPPAQLATFPSLSPAVISPSTSTQHSSSTSPYSPASSAATSGGGPIRARPRKQQCPECLGWYSNLAAHRAIHMEYSSRPHTCKICGRGFSRPNDLLRHQKAHQGDSPFACPFYSADPRCHSTGGFSRCDTYKNHLKSMHFDYPVGTKKKERNGAGGKCKGCLREFENADEWVTNHVEAGECPGL